MILPLNYIKDKLAALSKLRGLRLGDAVKGVIQATGLDKVAGAKTPDGKPCGGCEKRREALNRFKLPG